MRTRDSFIGCLIIPILCIAMIIVFDHNFIALSQFRDTAEIPPPVRPFLIEDGIPQRDLMFSLHQSYPKGKLIGFINADGSDFTTCSFRTNTLVSGPYTLHYSITWNRTGTAAVTRFMNRWNPGSGSPLVIDQSGKARVCWEDIYNSEGRLRLVDDSSVIIRIEDENDVGQIVLLDMNTCETTQILYTETEGRTAYEAGLNQDGWLWVERSGLIAGWELAVINPAGEEVKVIPDARNPAWSADGQWLAYWSDFGNGIFIEHRSEGEGRRIVEINGYPESTWSPDGEWLAYTGVRGIMKVNIETGEQILVFDGWGESPSWNWGKAADSNHN